ncbi:hypothetical protein CVT25_014431 [Psilocybe cyanescens]|uniref:Protein transport protein sec16 n=1 Tax=Psilocybe cyanescens TaxID=93625 RepID=A0A409XR61_PSICY|nr:hypothetical protein CVT25_014431 [Psilocybe cyanescens]
MNGVEAAASLFGSEESSSDLFATLGTDSTSPHPPSDSLFPSNTSSSEETESFDFSSHPNSYPVQPSTFQEYPSNSEDHTASDNVQYSSTTNDLVEQWSNHQQNDIAPDYSKYAAQQTDVSPQTSGYNAYAPSTYTAPTTTYSTYGAYDPPATTSSYGPYPPNSHTKAASTPSYFPQAVPSSAPNSSYNKGIAPIPPVPTPAKSTITRPKVSNAYDPPFLQTLPNRKTPRSANSGTQLYAQYQSHIPPSYPQTAEASLAYSRYQQPAVHNEYAHPSTESNLDVYSRGTGHTQPVTMEQPYNQNSYAPQIEHTHESYPKHSAKFEQSYPPPKPLGPDLVGDAFPRIPSEQAYVAENYPNESHVNGHGSLSTLLDSSYNVTQKASEHQDADESTYSKTISPRSIPLPFSPPQQKVDIQDPEEVLIPNDENANKLPSPPQHKQYAPQQSTRREMSINREIHDPYAPKINQGVNNYIPRTSSPLSISHGRVNERKPPASVAFNSSTGISSSHPSIPRPLVGVSAYATPPNTVDVPWTHQPPHWSESKLGPQDIIVKNTSAQYAPSPSLIGANDPLSRTSARAPVVTFGFGGKMVTCFHGMPGQNAGFDIALSSRTSSELKIHVMQKFLPESVLNSSGPSYPGPLLADPGTSSISLVRPGQTTQTKTKKTGVLAYLASRASEIHQGLGYFVYAEKQAAEDKLVLVRLLSIMVENDGRLLGTPQADSAVRSALVPRLKNLASLQDGAALQDIIFYTDIHTSQAFNSAPFDETPISVVTLRPSALDKIEDLLLQGDRRQAYQFAMDQKLWSHAMIIASSIDKESWKEVVNDFLRTELGSKEEASRGTSINGGPIQPHKSNRDSLRMAYSLYSGQGAAAVQELVPINLLQRTTGRLQVQTPIAPSITPRTPNFPSLQRSVPVEALSNWAETTAMIISSPLTPETSGALTALGDQLLSHNWVEAAHSCYLLSLQSSVLGGMGNPSARITLVGSKNPAEAMKDSDAIILSEILEFAMSLVPTVKGHEAFHGLPHLQAYKFIRAVSLAAIGDIQLANRQTSPHTTVALLEQLQGLQQRISGVFHGEKGGSWIGGKLSKPSLDTIGGWLEGRFTKLVTGETDEPTSPAEHVRSTGQPFAGPFAHYSTISSTTPSARSSPQPSFTNLSALPPQRTTSAMATSTPYSQVQIERASSAMGYLRQKASVPTKDGATSISSSQSSPTGYGLNGQSRYDNSYSPQYNTTVADEAETPVQGGASWWGANDEVSNTTPTAATFMSVDETSVQASSEGFISLMDDHSFSVGPQHVKRQSSLPAPIDDEDDDDLGLGNSKPKPKKEEVDEIKEQTASSSAQATTPTPPKPSNTPAPSSGSWLGRWWKKSESTTPAPIKASLGEESTFYYDAEQKRWINKKQAGGVDEVPKASAPPPPPSRAQTASPGMSSSKSQPSAGPPPLRSASAIDLSTEPPTKAPMRIRSNLAPPTESAPSTPTGTRMNAGPPPGRPKSSAAKRNIRSRYVDVFQQEGGGA